MKVNEAPEKIIISADRDSEELNDYWYDLLSCRS